MFSRSALRRSARLFGSRCTASCSRAVLFGALGMSGGVLAYTMLPKPQALAQQEVANCFFGGAKPPFDAKKVRDEIEAVISADYSNGPLLIRLAWHEAASWNCKSKDGAPNTASMRFKPECDYAGNKGLDKARNLLEPIKKANPGISYADLWAYAACVAVEEMAGPKVTFRWGRQDSVDGSVCAPPRLPDAAQTQNHIRDVFSGLGFNDRETVALIGAHTVGECHADRSGFVGPWTHDKYGFDNSFYTELLNNEWVLNPNVPNLQFMDRATKNIMMLPADVALLIDPKFLKIVKEFAASNEVWGKEFAKAFQKLLELGNHNLNSL